VTRRTVFYGLVALALLIFVVRVSQPGLFPDPTPLWACGGFHTTDPNGKTVCIGLPTQSCAPEGVPGPTGPYCYRVSPS
jgi:hypothetical protein